MLKIKQKVCRVCRDKYTPYSSTATVCSPGCAIQYQALKKIKATKKADKEFKRETKRRKIAAKTRSEWYSDVQVEFNKYIRARDYDQPCISCQRSNESKKNAGHYLSVGANAELRFNEINCHLQCEHCNSFKSGNQAEYRIHLINKIGLSLVEWLEGPHKPLKATIDELRRLQGYYRQRAKEALAYAEGM